MSSSESEVDVHEEQTAVGGDVEEFDPNVPIPEYAPEELEKLVAFVQQMTVLFALDQRDWSPETLEVVRRWFMDVRKLALLIYYDGNNLSASLNFQGVIAHDLTYFLREPNQIFTVDDFHDEVIFGVLHEDLDGALLAVLDKVYSPIFFQYEDWKENVKANLMGALNRFLSLLTGLHHKISGVTVLYVPNTVKNLVPEVAVLDRELMKNLEAIAVHWGSQIRLCLTDKTQLVPYDLLCPPDEYDFWKYRYEILQGLHAQLTCEDVENIIKVLRRAQSVYIKAICELTEDCEREMHEAKSNIKYLQLLVEPCQELNDSENPAAIAPLLPRIVHLFRYIWLNSTYFNTSESITGLFRCLTNQIIIFCRKHIEIEKILNGNPRFGIKMCNMTIDCCLSYKKIYEIMSKQHAERNPEVGWELDVPMIFNHLDAFIERLIDLIDIAEAMIVFGRMDETENIMKPRFGGPRGADLEATCEKVERMFISGLERIKTKSMDILLDVHSNQWYEDVLKYRQLVKDLEEVIQRLFANAFTNISNVEEGIEVLITLYFLSYRQTIRHVYIQKVSYVWNMFIDEIDNTNKRILSRATVRYSWVPKDASRALNLKTSIERLKFIKSRFDYAEWLPEVPQSITATNEFNKLVTDYTKNMKKAYEDWASKYEYDLQTKLDRPLIARSKTHAGLIECNIDREILDICEHAKYFNLMGYEIPTPIQVIYAKYDILKSTCNNVLTVALDYNKIITMLSLEERKLFRALIQSCDRKISPGMSKLTWGGELSDEYIAECVKQTSEFQGFVNIYKRATKEIGDICEKICDIPILRFRTSVPIKLETLIQNLKSYRSKTLKKLLEYYKIIIELIVVVYKGFEPQISNMTSEWLLYIQRFDKMIEAALLTSSKNSLIEIYNNLHGDGSMDPSPILSVEIDVVNKKIVFEPELQSIADLLSNVLVYIIKCVELFPRLWEKFQLPEYDDCKQFYLIVSDNPECVELQIKINGEIRKNEEELVEYLDNWLPFRAVWELDKENFMQVYENTDLSAAQFDSNIERYTEIANQVTMLDTVTNVYFIVVNASKLKNTLLGHIEDWQQRHMNLLKKTAYDRMRDTYEYIHKNGEAVIQVPRTIAAMKESIYLHERLMREAPRKKAEFPGLYELFRVLDKYEVPYSHEMHDLVARLESEWQTYLKKLAEAEEMLGTTKEDFKLMLLRGAEKFKATAKSLMDEFSTHVPTSSSTHPETAVLFLKFAREELDEMMDAQKALIDDLIAFKVSLGKNQNLKKMGEDLAQLDEVWDTVVEWYYAWEEYKVGNFWRMNIQDMDDKSDDLYRRLNKLYKSYYDKNWEILEITKKKVYEFRKTLPLLEALKNPAMRLRHWNRVRVAVKQNFDEQSEGFNLESIMKMNFQNFEEDILDISTAATMELNIENGLKNIQDIWETLNIEMIHFKDGVYRIKSVDECFEVLEEHLTQISTMKSTRFIAPFAAEADYWEKTLAYIMETLEKALVVQRSWLYLDNIFSGDDIKKQLPGEFAKFRDLTDQWRIISSKMAGVSSAVKATHLRPPPFLLNRFDHMDKMFEAIQRALEVYLETKRQAFPRFYFISNDDLLEILGNSKKPNLVQPHLKKMFDNLCKIELKKDTVRKVVYWNTLGMYSAEDEYVEFTKPFRIIGPSEAWLNQVDTNMLSCLKAKLVLTRAAFKKMKAQQDVWLNQWPGQLCLTTSQIQWTTNCVRSLVYCKMVEDRWPLKKLKKKQNKVLSKLSEMSRMELENQLRLKVNSMITLEIHGRDVIERMYKNNCTDITNFEWFAQLRFYWNKEKDVCVIRQTNTEYWYGYEYSGNSGRLVITPLTDRCYITLTTALHLFRGGSPKGPAGTGKTETVKDLGKALGMWVVVTNCSEGLDYKSIGKIFSGLAQTGAWGCFDEFNRINIEVLSVVAQQILSIYTALAVHLKRFIFEGFAISLKPTIGLFITMNPGYAGRTELPDNLKSMFRPISMCVPDTIIIAENILFSDGFQATKSLSRKVFALYQLAMRQLSHQYHYDFGLRSMAALLRYAGRKRRQLKGVNEDQIVYLAMRDMNVARLTSNDLPLFNGIMSDIFPGVTVPSIDYEHFKTAIEDELKSNNKQVIHAAVNKTIELYETKNSRHSSMILGDTGTAKSTTWQTLQGAFKRLKAAKMPGWEDAIVYPMNPKAVTLAELYGEYNLATGEWFDGILSAIMRTVCAEETPTQKWILFDGPVDAVWIENMNSVMDDNKLLTLINGERITMPPQVSLLFEVHDLAVASPATVSRCGMVYNDYSEWGWKPYVKSWLARQRLPDYVNFLKEFFWRYLDKVLEFKRVKCVETVATNELNVVISFCNLLDCFGTRENGITGDNVDALESMTKLWFFFCMIWSVCATVNKIGRVRIDAFIREMEGLFPIKDTVYDYYVDPPSKSFAHWEEKLSADWELDTNLPFYKIVVPTVDTVRYEYLVSNYLRGGNPVLIVGDVGTGKTSTALSVIEGADKERISVLGINISAQTTASGLQDSIESRTEKRTKTTFAPIGGKTMIVFMDDFNMPAKDVYGSQPPLELIRQWIDYKFWYNRKTQTRTYIIQTLLLAAMGPPGGGRQVISGRTMSRFYIINMTFPSEATIMRIFGTMLQQKLNPFPSDIKSVWQKITHATINLYEAVNDKMLPTPKKMHYLFNLRDISRVFQGLLRSCHEYHNTKVLFLRLWYHESARVFSDRLVDDDDQNWFSSKIDEVLGRYLESTFNQLCPEKRSPIFGDFKSPQGYYEDLTNVNILKDYMNDMLNEYNQLPGTARLDVVFFEEALEHITRLARVLSQPRGHMLNIGIGGSGRQILTRLASYLCELTVFKIEVSKKYDTSSFREDLKTLYKMTGVKNKATCFLFTGDQVVENNFLEIINNMLSTGEINLFKPEEFEELKSDLEGPAKRAGIMLNTENLYNFFMDTVRTNLHVCLCFSPIGESFRSYIRQYPALVNATTIDVLRDWPQNALLEVALKFLSYCKLYIPVPGQPREGEGTEAEAQMAKDMEIMLRTALAKIFSVVHTKVEKMSARMLLEVKRYNYVTSINYLELVMGYQAMLEKKRFDISSNADKLRNGLSKIAETQEKVELMSEDLKVSQAKVRDLTIECDEFLVELSAKAREADEQKESVTAKSIIIGREEIECKKLAAQAQAELVEVMPALEAAVRALDSLSKKDITEVKSYGRPPVKVQKVMEGVMILLQKDTSWEATKKVLGESRFLDDLKNFDKDNIPDKVLRKIAIYTHDPELEPEKVGVVSFACKSLMEWINAIENYGHVYRVVAPKKQALEDAMNSLKMKQLILEEAQKKLAELEAKLNELNNQFRVKQEEQNELQRKARQLELQLERAIILVESLGGEQERWKETVKRLDREFENLPGDCLIATAFMSYLGPFDTKYRIELQEVWFETVCEQQIPVTPDVDMIKFLVDPVTIQEWNIQGLPSDDFSTENGILITRGQRWPLAIDPQGQAHSWIRNLEKDKLRIIDFGQADYVKVLERALQFGTPILIQNVPQELDPTISPILRRSFVFQGGLKLINFNDKYIIYNDHFKLYITTKLPNPHYPPEIVAKVTLVNFSVKEIGLRNQLLGIIVREEKPILEEQKNNLVFTIARSKRILLDLEDEILRLLKESKGSILEDEELFNTLQKSRQVSATVKESLATAEVTEVEIDEARLGYQPAATRAAILFFVLMDMAKIDPMYQFSLNAYTLLFIQSIERSTKCANLVERITNINNYHTYAVYKNTCRGLFERHKLLFSMHMCSKILDAAEELNVSQYDFLLKGGIILDRDSQAPNPFPDWITEASWDNITELDKEAGFHGIISSFEQHPKEWQEWYAAPQPEKTPLVAEWKDVLDDFQKILVVRCLRLDRMSFCVSMFITNTLGEEFIQPPVLDLKSVFDESMPQTPLIFILSPGVDPTSALLTLAEQMKMDKKLKSLSLGQGQSPAATKMLMTGIKEGHWVFLANCHLSLSWMPALDKMIEQMQTKKLHKRFRLWLSSSPHPEFPISILQTGIKMTTEPPRGIKANMKRLFAMITDENFKRSKVLSKYKKLLYALCFFHTILLERKKFQQLGWNVVYSFNDSDFEVSETILSLYLNEYESETPWGALKYLIAAVNYGGHVTDDWDRRLLSSYIDQFYNDEALETVNYRLSALPHYYIPRDGTIQNYQDQINLLPNFDKPEAFGQHMNADIASLISESRYMFETLLSLQVQAASSEGESREDKVLRLAGDMESKVPDLLPYEQTAKLLGRNRTPLDVVLLQEIERYNKLLKGMKADLRDLQKGIKGLVVMSSELEDVFGAVYDGRVPAVWLKAYKSLKPLAAWARDLIFRVDHFATWAKKLRPPPLFWMTAFTFPPGFLTAVLQQAARSTLTPIDELTWEYTVFVEDDDTVARMILESGVCIRGTFLEGAGWNRKEKCLQEPKPMELVYPMPVIHFKPIEIIKKKTRGLYQCPCYYFPERAISYVTVCDLRVGERTSDFWIKRGTALLLSLAS